MRQILLSALAASLMVSFGCSHHCEKCEAQSLSDHPEPAPAYVEVQSESGHHDEDTGVRVWRFPFVQIAIDPHDPHGVGVRVADDESGHEYVNLGVNWDD